MASVVSAKRPAALRLSSILAVLCSWAACGLPADGVQSRQPDWDAERRRMVDEQLRARDISSPGVLDAMRAVPRHLFVPEAQRAAGLRRFPAADRPRARPSPSPTSSPS